MAGKNKTNAWNSIKFIKAHLPIWQEIGMRDSFLTDVIEPKYKACSIDVETALSCDIMNFETAYNQPDFIVRFKEICKKHRMPYGKVKSEINKKAEEFADLILVEFSANKPKRKDDQNKELGFKDINQHLVKIDYTPVKINNLDEIVSSINENRNGGDTRLVVNNTSIELLLNLARDKATIKRINEVTRLSEASITRYYTMLQRFGYGKMSKNKKTLHTFVIDYSKVDFADGYTPESETYVDSLFGGSLC